MLTQLQLERFLREVDRDFPVPLSQKQDLSAFAQKLLEKATLCEISRDGEIQSLVAGYTENLTAGKAYISLVATLAKARGNGFAPKLIRQFLQICREKQIPAVHLYTVAANTSAVKMYRKLGFEAYLMNDEPRPEDAHLIIYLNKENKE